MSFGLRFAGPRLKTEPAFLNVSSERTGDSGPNPTLSATISSFE